MMAKNNPNVRPAILGLCGILLLASPSVHADGGLREWEWLGPGNAGGCVRAIAIHPTNNPLRILAASPGGGIWLSTNSGALWNLTDGWLPSLVVSCLSICTTNPAIVYAGTGESFAGFRGAPGEGVYKSTDGGSSWTQLASTVTWKSDSNRFVNFVAVHPTNANLVLAATDAGIQRSTNGGVSWDSPLPRVGRVTDVKWVTSSNAVAGLDSPIVYPGVSNDMACALYSRDFGRSWSTSTFAAAPGTPRLTTTLSSNAPAGGNEIYVESWYNFCHADTVTIGTGANAEVRRVSAPHTNTIALSAPSLANTHLAGETVTLRISQRTALAVMPGGARIYASVGAGGGTIWRSDDAGQTYNFIGNPNEDDGDAGQNYLMASDATTRRAFYSNVIWAGPPAAGTNDVVVVGGVTTLRSVDGGVSFTMLNTGSYTLGGALSRPHSDYHALVSGPNFPTASSVYFGNDGGIQRANDIFTVMPTSGWTNLANGLGLTQLWHGRTTTDGSWLVGCGQDIDAVLRAPAEGTNDWYLMKRSSGGGIGDSRACAVEDGTPFPNFYNLRNLQFWKSTSAVYFVQSMSGITNPCAASGDDSIYDAIVVDPNDPAVLVVGGVGLWRSTDRGDSWTQLRAAAACGQDCSALEMVRGHPTLVWAGYKDGRISHTVGAITSWINVNTPGTLPACAGGTIGVTGSVSDILIDADNTQRVFVTFVGLEREFARTCTQNVFMTTNGGACWIPLMGTPPFNLPPTAAYSIAMNPSNHDWLYVGTDKGVYASEDGGLTWGRTPAFATHEGPYNVRVTELSWHDPDYLVAATYGLGMFRARAPTILYVDKAYTGPVEIGTVTNPFKTVQGAVAVQGHGTMISVRSNDYNEAGAVLFEKRGTIRSTSGPAKIH